MSSRPPTDTARPGLERIVKAVLLTLTGALVFAMYHLFGNTTEVNVYGRSAFAWMIALWKSTYIFGGAENWAGVFSPFATLFLLWKRRTELRAAKKIVCWPALALVALALLLHWMGARAQQTRLSLLALVFFLWSAPFFLYGPRVARLTLFPIALLIYCVPLNFLDVVIFPMQQIATALAVFFLQSVGLEATRSGSVLLSMPPGAYAFDGGGAAAGLGTLLLLSAATAVAGSLLKAKAWQRLILFFASGPVLVAANQLRLVAFALIAEIGAPAIAAKLHDGYSVLLVYVLSLALLAAVYRLMNIDFVGLYRSCRENLSSPTSSSSL
jgi:exosortase